MMKSPNGKTDGAADRPNWYLTVGTELAELVLAIPHGIDPRTRECAHRFLRIARGKKRL
jgi:hypothetical protein